MWGPKSSFSHRFFGRGGKRSLATTEAEEDVLPSHGSLSRSLQAYSGPPYNFGSSNLRFGTSTSLDSLDTSTGNLKQPFYYNGATWRKLTYSSNALDFVMKTGGTPHGPGTGTSGTGGTEVSFGSATVDVTGMDPSGDGHGLLIVSQTATVGSATVTLTREYTIANADSRTATMNVRVRAEGASVPSVLMWMGTRDDYIGSTDSPGKDIGDFDSDGNFVVGEGGKTVKVTSGSEAVFFTTPSENAYAVQARCCSFNNVVNMNPFNVVPGTSASNTELRLSIPGADGSYGVYFNLGDVADGGEVVATAAYAAGSIEDLAAVTEEVAAAANPCPTQMLDSWEEGVGPIAHLPKLALLNLNHNRIGSVPRHAGEAASGFGRLKHLMLRANPIDNWPSVDALDTFPALTEMRLAELPLLKDASGAVA